MKIRFQCFIFQPSGAINKDHGEFLQWLNETRQRLTTILDEPVEDLPTEYRVN